MSALVLGGTGFVGRRLVETLHADGMAVTVLNRGRANEHLPAGVDRLVADRADPAAVRTALAGTQWEVVYDVSGVVRAAGAGAVDTVAAELDGRVGRYVYVSSQSVYRADGAFPWTEESPVVDADTSTYAGFKVASERALLARHAAGGLPVTIARPAAIYGPHNNILDMEAAMFRRLLHGRPVLLPHGGLVVGSYGHVDDLCRALVTMATHPDAEGVIFNITTGAVTSAAYVATLAAVAGVEADIVALPDEVLRVDGPPLCSRLFLAHHHGIADPTKLRARLGVEPRYDLFAGHAHTLQWLRETGALDDTDATPDPLWGRAYDLDAEAAVAAVLRAPIPEENRMTDPLRVLQDRQEIAAVAARYTRALDTKDWELLRSCFVAEPVFVHPKGRLEGWDGILARTRGALDALDGSQHLLGNVEVEVDGDTGTCRSYFHAQHVRHEAVGGELYVIAGSYTDTLERTEEGWRIAERVQAYSWREGNRAVVHP